MKAESTLDVSSLPAATMDHRSPIWWGNLWLLVIETTMFAILVAVYFYFRVVDFNLWPPPQPHSLSIIFHPVPDLLVPTVNLVFLLVSVAPMIWVDRACLARQEAAVRIGLLVCIALGVAAIVLRFYEFKALQFRWDDNAYAATIWTILGVHLAHVITATAELLIMAAWVFTHGMDVKHARDIRVTALYWYWVAGTWLLLYALVYLSPRVL
jgi:heme/copper-type cytochrome/quinol oxidase subunit 3